MSEDLHSPTTAGPTPTAAGGAVSAGSAGESASPPPVAGPSQAADSTATAASPPPPGTGDGALLGSPSATERPEVQAGMAFAGGLLFAMVLKRITR